MVMAVTSQAVYQIEIMRSPSKFFVVVAKGNNHSMTAVTRGQKIDRNCTQISKGAEMQVPEIQNRIIFLPSGALSCTLCNYEHFSKIFIFFLNHL